MIYPQTCLVDGLESLKILKKSPIHKEYKNSYTVIKAIEAENETLKKLLGEKDLKIAILEDLLKKTTQR
mgnify:CR=1 FL=1